jgi:quercetin dioxygenase-like cupin family protein
MIKHHFSDHLYAKEVHIPAGHTLTQHKHKFDHLSILAKGAVKAIVDGVVTEIVAPACLNIEKNKQHSVVALTDCVWYCIHSTTEDDATKIEEILIRVNRPEKG